MQPYDNVSLVYLREVPKGWKPVVTQIIDDGFLHDPALDMAKHTITERGYDIGNQRFGVYRRPVPNPVPYADSDRTLVELYAL